MDRKKCSPFGPSNLTPKPSSSDRRTASNAGSSADSVKKRASRAYEARNQARSCGDANVAPESNTRLTNSSKRSPCSWSVRRGWLAAAQNSASVGAIW